MDKEKVISFILYFLFGLFFIIASYLWSHLVLSFFEDEKEIHKEQYERLKKDDRFIGRTVPFGKFLILYRVFLLFLAYLFTQTAFILYKALF